MFGISLQEQFFECSTCHLIRCSRVGFLGILFLLCHRALILTLLLYQDLSRLFEIKQLPGIIDWRCGLAGNRKITLGSRLTVGQRTLDPFILVRIQASQHFGKLSALVLRLLKSWVWTRYAARIRRYRLASALGVQASQQIRTITLKIASEL